MLDLHERKFLVKNKKVDEFVQPFIREKLNIIFFRKQRVIVIRRIFIYSSVFSG